MHETDRYEWWVIDEKLVFARDVMDPGRREGKRQSKRRR